jgi:hypothetical protein
MANIPGINTRVRPGVFVRQRVRTNTVSIAGGLRTTLIMGEGRAEETLAFQARGGGLDGVNPDFSGNTNAPDGRHFQISQIDLVPNRTDIRKNGVALRVLEQSITAGAFDSRYDVRVDPLTGRVQLQGASLQDFGTESGLPVYYKRFASNSGNGTLDVSTTSLLSTNAQPETWTVRCTAVSKDGTGTIIPGRALFSVTGSVTGAVRDTAGDQIRWKSDGNSYSNGVLQFSITEGSQPFNVGDKFVVTVNSGVLVTGDSLDAVYIANSFVNDPQEFFSPTDLYAKHGQPSEDNTLALGAAMAFENGAASVVALQCKPPVPRQTSELLMAADNPLSIEVEGATGNEDMEDCIFAINGGGTPDTDSKINVFVVNPDGSEEQIRTLDKAEFYDPANGDSMLAVYTNFSAVATNSYTAVMLLEMLQEGTDGYVYDLGGDTFFQTTTGVFSASDVGNFIDIFDAGATNTFGRYEILDVGDGYGATGIVKVLLNTSVTGSVAQSGSDLRWFLLNSDTESSSAYFCLSDDIVDLHLTAGKGLRIQYVDVDDADYFDTNWLQGYQAAEQVDVQFVVPLPRQAISNIFAAGKAHVLSQSTILNAQERILICGAINGLVPENLTGAEDAAVENIGIFEGIQGDDPQEVLDGDIEDLANYSVLDAFGDTQRVIYVGPDQIVRNLGAAGNTVLSGYFMAPALSGYLSAKSFVAEPATNKTLAGFSIPRSRSYRPSVVNSLIAAGVCLLEPVAGGGRIVHGITTASSGAAEDEEISIVEVRDYVVRVLRNGLRSFVGRINSPTILQELSAAVDKIMRAMETQGLITGYADIVVSINPTDARQVDIGVRAFPAGPLNYVFADIEFTLGG